MTKAPENKGIRYAPPEEKVGPDVGPKLTPPAPPSYDASPGSDVSRGPSKASTLAVWYTDQILIQAAVQAIPYIGGSLNTLLAGAGMKQREQRVLHFLDELKTEMGKLREPPRGLDQVELSDFLVDTIEKVARTRSADKRVRFARLLAGQVATPRGWDEAEMSARLLGDLGDLHVRIVAAAVNAPICDEPFKGLRAVAVSKWSEDSKAEKQPLRLDHLMPDVTSDVLHMACSELLARGLLHDEGTGRWDGKATQVFAATTLAERFLQWIGEARMS